MKRDTRIVHSGLHPEKQLGAVNPPVYHVSTVTYPTIAAMRAAGHDPFNGMRYGRYGTPTSQALEEAVCDLEGGYRSVSTASGLAAIAGALTALLKSGDHVLVADSCYGPTRRFCDEQLKRNGVASTYYDPSIGAGIADLFTPETRLVYVESPGSLTFEMQDVPAIAAVAHARGALVVMDNTWGTPLFFKPFEKGVDVSIQAATKFIVGHSDAMLGVITCGNHDLWHAVKTSLAMAGVCAGADEVYLGLRGLRTLGVRLQQHQASGIKLASWLQTRPEVVRVLHPALPGDPGHAIWKRDFTGAPGLFAFEVKPCPSSSVDAFLDSLEHFSLGYSWGGFESLIIPASPGITRTAKPWEAKGPIIRIHTGLEDPDDLIGDLVRGFEALRLNS
jgi:cystathionine beta-lyase